ncbi:hypothetical protein [Streptomyces sp. cg35]|uniref:hypothetical protein n=1 Tax=Streptomyces sp. cg35 TaxID=3421650 RepID=UPI003D171736
MTVPRLARAAALAGTTGIAAAAVLGFPGTAAAQDVALVPGSRTSLCHQDLCSAGDRSPYDVFPYNAPRTDRPVAHWIRSDSQEHFFSRSDVVLDGGDGEVTGSSGGGRPGTAVAAIGASTAHTRTHAEHEGHTTPAEEPAKGPAKGSAGTLAAAGAVALVGGAVLHLRLRRPPAGD